MKPDSHESSHPIHSPELRRLVALAHDQPLPPLRIDAERLLKGVAAARQARNHRFMTIGGLALAAGLAGLALTNLGDHLGGAAQTTGPEGHVAQDMSPEPASQRARPGHPVLAAGVRVVAQGEDTPSPTVLGAWEVGLAPGRYAVEVEPHPGPELLRARSVGGSVELHHGRVEIVVAASSTHASLHEGVATWIAPDGARSPLTITATEPVAPVTPTVPVIEPAHTTTPSTDDTVRALARRAEALLTAGQRDGAISVLTKITTVYAHEPAARGALLDLAPLLKAAGRPDEARCAYQLYLDRYPGKAQLADDVRKALTRLGDGPACDALRPR